MSEKMNEMGKIPMIAIIGRPNVGKSTLFNRLLGKRRAITSPEPGVTRDAIEERWYLGNHPVTLVDSGGIKQEKTGLDDLVTDKSISLFASSDAILFLMDCTEVTGEDHQIMEDLRPYTDKVVLVVNKVDDQRREDLVWDYFQYGFQRVVGISAAHGLGIEELEDCLCGMLDLTTEQQAPEEEATVKIAIMGKPNTGKSTLTNLLVGDEVSLVSDIPGTTRDVIRSRFTYKNTLFSVMDTAGIRRKGKVSDDVEYYSVNRSIKAIEESDVVLLMVDSEEGISEQDKKIANLVVRRGRGIILVLNKIDLLHGPQNQLNAIEDRTRYLFPILSFAPLILISAKEGKNISKLLDSVWAVWRQNNKRIETAQLNTAIKAWGEKYQPPRGETGHYKVYYGTQIGVNPVRILLFVNRIKDFPPMYIQYLKNCIRRDLGFTMIPVEVDLRERKRNPSLHDRAPKVPTLTAIKKNAATKAAPRSGGRAKAKPRLVKPGNKAALGKAIERAQKRAKSSAGKRGR